MLGVTNLSKVGLREVRVDGARSRKWRRKLNTIERLLAIELRVTVMYANIWEAESRKSGRHQRHNSEDAVSLA